MPEQIDVRAIRKSLQLTQEAFALRFGFSLSSVREWEQKRSRPDRAARIVLTIVQCEPQVVEQAAVRVAALG
jgi:putative transcriptional regulator